MSLTYFEISYPNFVLGSIIDPEEANQNNYEIVTKVNDIVEFVNINKTNIDNLILTKSDLTYVDNNISNLAGVGRTVETIYSNANNMIEHKKSSDHDSRYYTKDFMDVKQWETHNILDGAITASKLDPSLISDVELVQYIGIAELMFNRLEVIQTLGV